MGTLRLLLALAVVFTHLPIANVRIMSGALAVQAFFVVSGFYMSLVLDGKYRDTRLFYGNRLLRIFPPYFVMLAVAAAALFVFNASATASTSIFATAFAQPGRALLFGFENLAILGQELLFWFRLAPDGVISFDASGPLPTDQASVAWQALLVPQAWSLSLELMFYALAPLLARQRTSRLLLIAAASIALREAGHWLPISFATWQGRLFPTVLFMFIFGMLAQRMLPLAARLPRTVGWYALAAMLLLILGLPRLQLPTQANQWLVLPCLALALPFVFNVTRTLAFDRLIGELSYPIYLTHLAVIGVVLTYSPPAAVWLALGGTLLLSLLLFYCVDRPVDRWRQARLLVRVAPEKKESQPISRVLS